MAAARPATLAVWRSLGVGRHPVPPATRRVFCTLRAKGAVGGVRDGPGRPLPGAPRWKEAAGPRRAANERSCGSTRTAPQPANRTSRPTSHASPATSGINTLLSAAEAPTQAAAVLLIGAGHVPPMARRPACATHPFCRAERPGQHPDPGGGVPVTGAPPRRRPCATRSGHRRAGRCQAAAQARRAPLTERRKGHSPSRASTLAASRRHVRGEDQRACRGVAHGTSLLAGCWALVGHGRRRPAGSTGPPPECKAPKRSCHSCAPPLPRLPPPPGFRFPPPAQSPNLLAKRRGTARHSSVPPTFPNDQQVPGGGPDLLCRGHAPGSLLAVGGSASRPAEGASWPITAAIPPATSCCDKGLCHPISVDDQRGGTSLAH